MIYTVRLREEAEHDLEEAASWYESQKPGLGHNFLNIVEQALNSITQNPFFQSSSSSRHAPGGDFSLPVCHLLYSTRIRSIDIRGDAR